MLAAKMAALRGRGGLGDIEGLEGWGWLDCWRAWDGGEKVLDVEAFFADAEVVVHERGGDGAYGADDYAGEKFGNVGIDLDGGGWLVFLHGGRDGKENRREGKKRSDGVGQEEDKSEEKKDLPGVILGESHAAFHGAGGGLLFNDGGGNGKIEAAGEIDARNDEK
jgi:hypothetical protein